MRLGGSTSDGQHGTSPDPGNRDPHQGLPNFGYLIGVIPTHRHVQLVMAASLAAQVRMQLDRGDVDTTLDCVLITGKGERIRDGARELAIPAAGRTDEGHDATPPFGDRGIHPGEDVGQGGDVRHITGRTRAQAMDVAHDILHSREVLLTHGNLRPLLCRLAQPGASGWLGEMLDLGCDEKVHPIPDDRATE